MDGTVMFNAVEQKPAMNLLFFQRGVGCCRGCGSVNICKESDSGKPISFKSETVVFHFFLSGTAVEFHFFQKWSFSNQKQWFFTFFERVRKDGFKCRRFSSRKRRCGGWWRPSGSSTRAARPARATGQKRRRRRRYCVESNPVLLNRSYFLRFRFRLHIWTILPFYIVSFLQGENLKFYQIYFLNVNEKNVKWRKSNIEFYI